MFEEQIAKTGTETQETRRLLPIDIQFFASDGAGDNGGAGDGAEGGEGADNNTGGEKGNETSLSTEALEKLIQSKVDKATAKLGKEKADLQKELDKMKREKLTDDEVKKLELADKEKAIAEKEQALLEKENRLFATKAIKEIGLDDGSPESLKLLDFVMDKDEAGITAKAKAFKELVDRFVKAEVDKTFKSKGRNPNGGGGNNDEGGSNSDNSIAAKLGEQTAAMNKASNDILKHYYGGDK